MPKLSLSQVVAALPRHQHKPPDESKLMTSRTNSSRVRCSARCLGMVLPGDQIGEVDENGERIVGDSFAILFNAHQKSISFRLGTRQRDVHWTWVLDTAEREAA